MSLLERFEKRLIRGNQIPLGIPYLVITLLSLPSVVLTGHVGWYSKDAVKELQTRGAQEVLRVLSGGSPQGWINRW